MTVVRVLMATWHIALSGRSDITGRATPNESPSHIRIARPFYFPSVSAAAPAASNFPYTCWSSRQREAVAMTTNIASASPHRKLLIYEPVRKRSLPSCTLEAHFKRTVSPAWQQSGDKCINFKVASGRPRNDWFGSSVVSRPDWQQLFYCSKSKVQNMITTAVKILHRLVISFYFARFWCFSFLFFLFLEFFIWCTLSCVLLIYN